jgi:putative tricarboxylic transport membrane protein
VKPFVRSGDFWSGLALAALGSWIVMQARGWAYMTEEGPGAGFFPIWYGSIMVVLSLLLVLGAVLKPSQGVAIVWPDVRRAMTCWAAFVACVALMPLAGFAVSFALLSWFIVKVMARQSQVRALAVAIGFSAGFYVLFELALDLSLPHGIFF